MFLEYNGNLSEGYTYFRGAFDLGDIDHDGLDEMVIADDSGGYHVYRYTPGGFVPMWISDPLLENGHIVSVSIVHEGIPGIRPQILLLDNAGTLYQVVYSGYFFEITSTYENYRTPGESGRLVITGMGTGERNVIIALPQTLEANAENGSLPEDSSDEPEDESFDDQVEELTADSVESENSDAQSAYDQWAGMTLYKMTSDGLLELTDEEISELEEGQVYFLDDLSLSDLTGLQKLESSVGRFFPELDYNSQRAGVADLDRDALLELLVAFNDPNLPIDRLEIWSEEEGVFTVRISYELPLLNEMVLGDIDGDGFTEIVGLTYDGEVLVYQYDPLTVLNPDGEEITWEYPHRIVNGEIWMSLGGFEALGCNASPGADFLDISLNDYMVRLNRIDATIECNGEVIAENVPDAFLESIPYLPFLSTLDCLAIPYTHEPGSNLVEVHSSE